MGKHQLVITLCVVLGAGAAAAQPTGVGSPRVPPILANRLQLARQLTHGEMRAICAMPASDRRFAQYRNEFEAGVLKLVSAGDSFSPSQLEGVQRLYNRLPRGFRYEVKGIRVPFVRKPQSKLTAAQRSALRTSADSWLHEMGLDNLGWVLRHNDQPMLLNDPVRLNPHTRDISDLQLSFFEVYHRKVGMWK
jgi:hypothetical protein